MSVGVSIMIKGEVSMKQNNENSKETLDVLEYMRSLAPIRMENPEIVTLAEWTEYWLLHYCNNIKPTTHSLYCDAVHQHINRVLGKVKLTELTREDVQHFINSLAWGIGIEEPLSPKSVKNIHGVLHKSFEIALRNRYITENPATDSDLPKCAKPEIHPLTTDQLNRFMDAIRGHSKESLFIVAVLTGCREGELIGLTWDCIDFESGSIHVYRQLIKRKKPDGGYYYEFGTLKNSKPRTLFPPPVVMEILRDVRKSSRSDFVFINCKGEHYTHSAVYNSFKKVMNKLGITNVRFHDLRHTYAVMSIQAGIDIKTLQYNMGHHSASFTLDVYGHCNDEMKRNSSRVMQQYVTTVILPSNG